jgi:hypothetical protein
MPERRGSHATKSARADRQRAQQHRKALAFEVVQEEVAPR